VALICNLILQAISLEKPRLHLISVDEKTGIQALERIAPDQPMEKGKPCRIEYEYTRHGTTCLMAAIDVGRGKLINHRLHPTRNEEDFVIFIDRTAAPIDPEDEIIFMADQLNIHQSESLVRWVAQQLNFEGDLGTKGYKGILKSMETRRKFLEFPEHRIRFVFTPKHCSWLNPIENWFAKLQRHVIKHGNFSSIKENKIESYIDFYNRCLVKPLKWKFKDFIKAQKLRQLNCD
jgi:transposase